MDLRAPFISTVAKVTEQGVYRANSFYLSNSVLLSILTWLCDWSTDLTHPAKSNLSPQETPILPSSAPRHLQLTCYSFCSFRYFVSVESPYLPLCVCLISVSMVSSRFTVGFTDGRSPPLLQGSIIFHHAYVHIFLLHRPSLDVWFASLSWLLGVMARGMWGGDTSLRF